MKGGQGIWIEGEKELYANMQKSLFSLTEAGRKGLRQAGMNIIADAKQNLKNGGHVASTNLMASGRVQKVEGDPDSIDVGFFSKDSKGGYAYYVEYGRRAGRMPPVDALMEWLRKKSSNRRSKSALDSALVFANSGKRVWKVKTANDLLRSGAWGLAKMIAKKGTMPHPFFGPAVEKNMADIENAIGSAVKEEL